MLEYLDELALGTGRWVPQDEVVTPSHILEGDELDLMIIVAGEDPHNFLGKPFCCC
ncbi:hypothetical protein K438DRAFT_1988216 [Mycena galopus ATCC 62051]|nr:hypothetical protein K438DRAFT_1988216 [Mycena galopus ATCC 62051]